MGAPQSVLKAIADVSPITCEHCGPVPVIYDETDDRPVISHAFADCPHFLEPDSPAAMELALSVDRELAKRIAMAQYGEPAVAHKWAMT